MSKRHVLRSRFAVGAFTVEMVMEPENIRAGTVLPWGIEWSPRLPHREEFTAAMLAQYRAGRNAFMLEISRIIGAKVAVFEC